MNDSVTVRVPAKVNLQLSVGPKGEDGYHPLSTVFQAVSIYDGVTASPVRAGSGVTLTASGEGVSEVPLGPDNLAARAALLLAERLAVPADVALHITKGIPVAGGMAGGSADAAAALVACAALWDVEVSDEVLLATAAALGSDVPFLLRGGTAVGTGRGDRLIPVLAVGTYEWVFATGYEGLATPAVYQRFDELTDEASVPQPRIDERVLHALRCGDAVALGAALSNDLQPATLALRPSLQALLEEGLDAGALGAVISGSGPTAAFLVADGDAAMSLTMRLSPSGLCRSLRRASGPVPGAQIHSR